MHAIINGFLFMCKALALTIVTKKKALALTSVEGWNRICCIALQTAPHDTTNSHKIKKSSTVRKKEMT